MMRQGFSPAFSGNQQHPIPGIAIAITREQQQVGIWSFSGSYFVFVLKLLNKPIGFNSTTCQWLGEQCGDKF
jgi:hypothetical protein